MTSYKYLIAALALMTLLGCQTPIAPTTADSNEIESEDADLTEDPVLREQLVYGDEASVKLVKPVYETTPVQSLDDAADDPAIWIHPQDPGKSLVLGTDKKSGIGVYNLQGEQVQFLSLGLPNNIDLRQNVDIAGWQGDVAAASNRMGDVISLMTVNETGVAVLGEFPSTLVEPYGFCMGVLDDKVLAFVTYKTGETVAHHIQNIEGTVRAPVVGALKFDTQLEGCVMNDIRRRIYIGEEEAGIWTASLRWKGGKLKFSRPKQIDDFNGNTGIAPDIEGVSLYLDGDKRYLIASSQGNDSYAVYNADNYRFLGRFRISAHGGIDGSQETDGLDVTSASLGPAFPKGLLVVQDGFNGAATPQNFKLVDWRDIETALGL